MAYVKIIYQDSPSTATPMNAANLNHMDDGIAENDRRLNELETAGVVNTFNGRSGTVVPDTNDYDINQIGATDGQDGYVPVWRNNGTPESPNWSFNMEAQGGSGHTIEDGAGTSLAQEPTLQFPDAGVSDDNVNQKTVVEVIQEVADISTPTADGIYVCDDGNDVPIGDIEEDTVEVDATTSMTYAQVLSALFADISFSRVTEDTYINMLGSVFIVTNTESGGYEFTNMNGNVSHAYMYAITYLSGTIHFYEYDLYTHTRTDLIGNNAWTNGKVTLHYGGAKSIINLLTNADDCMLDPQTSVKQAIVKKTDLTSIIATGSTNATGSTIASGKYFYLNGVLVRAKTSIASGATFTVNTNYEVVTAGALNGLSKVKVQSGLEAYTGVSNDWAYKSITFETPYKTIPLVTVNAPGDTSSSTSHTMPMIDNISETGFRFGWYAKTGTFNVRWQAIGEI